VRGPQLLEKWLGESERAVRELFSSARTASPCIIFFDELDALAPRRCSFEGGGGGGSNAGAEAARRVVNQLLCEMDGVENSSLFILGATNRPEAIDPALLRPGRFDRVIKVPLPSATARGAILRRSLRQCPLEPGLDLQELAESEAMEGMSGADVVEVARRAGMEVIRECLRNEGAEGAEGFLHVLPCIRASHLAFVISQMRRSVGNEMVAKYDEVEAGLMNGSIDGDRNPGGFGENGAEGIKRVVDAARVKIQTLQRRVELLESVLQSAGVSVPSDE